MTLSHRTLLGHLLDALRHAATPLPLGRTALILGATAAGCLWIGLLTG